METKPIGFMVACKKFFGQKPGQTLTEFRDEVNKLTPQDRLEMMPLLEVELGEKVLSQPQPSN